MSLLVTGSIGIDTVETPFGKRDDVIGGSAVYFSYAASFFTPVRLVGAVGEDAPKELFDVFGEQEVDTSGLEVRKGSKTFRWHGSYVQDLNEAVSIQTDLNILAEAAPKIPEKFIDSKFVFLANPHPALQQQMAANLKKPRLIVADTMNLWINTARPELLKTLKMIHGLVLNDGEARLLTEKKNLIEAARDVLKLGPKFVVIKKGEHGCLMCSGNDVFVLPAYPADRVVDPTGAGDSFAGGFMGYIAEKDEFDAETLKTAMAYGIVAASFNVEGFGVERVQEITRDDIEKRMSEYRKMLSF